MEEQVEQQQLVNQYHYIQPKVLTPLIINGRSYTIVELNIDFFFSFAQ
jgi:hypothetical protein